MDSRAQFTPTRWSLVAMARDGPATDKGREALNDLLKAWWPPLYAWLRRSGCGRAEAEDLTQDFCAWLSAGGHLDSVDPAHGRLRSYLLGCLQNFLRNHRRRESAARRGGKALHVPLDSGQGENWLAAAAVTPGDAYDHAWARGLMQRALDSVKQRYAGKGDDRRFDALRPFLSTEGSGQYAPTAEALGVTEGSIKGMVHRLRARFRLALEHEVRETMDRPSREEVEEEIGWVTRMLLFA